MKKLFNGCRKEKRCTSGQRPLPACQPPQTENRHLRITKFDLEKVKNKYIKDKFRKELRNRVSSGVGALGRHGAHLEAKISTQTARALEDKKEQQSIYQDLNKLVKRAVRKDTRVWTATLALRAQSAAENKNTRELYQITKNLRGKTSHQTPTIEIVSKWRLISKEYNVTTEDGYIITVERLYKNLKKNTPIIIGPGIFMNSLAFVNRGKKSLVNNGYDVWIINWRGTRFSRGHISLTTEDRDYWNMGIHKMALYDLKAILNMVHEETRHKGIYIGYSMGTTIGMIYNIKEQHSAEKTLRNMVNLAPVALTDHSKTILKYLSPLWPVIKPLVLVLWNGEVLPYNKRMGKFCLPYPFQMKFCELIYLPILGTTFSLMDPLTYPITITQNRDSVPYGTIEHYSQIFRSNRFQEFNYGLIGNMLKYKQSKPPLYDLNKLSVPETMFVGEKDIVATQKDARNLYDNLPDKSKCGYHLVTNYGHRDFFAAKNVNDVLFPRLLHTITQLESGKC
ncbi:hypothetical protein HHI36_016160 [Cryptolaemus montrouzieri]|uniref:AB hydrolase-1 domain-containing protein n=1 Tax=Cryptolaemus montrouzieri TaxID=559131 RepID=A0ABD2NJA3_9CUCU